MTFQTQVVHTPRPEPQRDAGISLLGSMLILATLGLGVALLTRQNILGARIKAAVENRMIASVVADSVMNAMATMPDSALCAIVEGNDGSTIYSSTTANLVWLSNWEIPGRIRNIRLRFQAYGLSPGATPTLFSKPFPSPCSGANPLANTPYQMQAEVEFTRNGGQSWEVYDQAEKWVPAP